MSYLANTPLVSTGNSSTSAIGPGDTFTGATDEVWQYSQITVFLDPDVSGTLKMQFSQDGVTWDRAKVVYKGEGDGARPHTLAVISQYFRIVYENGDFAQTKFNLQTIYHPSKSKALTFSMDQVINAQDDVELVRIANDILVDEARGAYGDRYTVHQFGYNSNVNNSTFETIWQAGGLYPFATSGSTLDVVSTEAIDSASGAGARSVVINGLDNNFDRYSETIELSGTTVSQTSGVFTRIYSAFVSAVGTWDVTNSGNISFSQTSGDALGLAQITAGIGQTELALYTIPRGHTGYLKEVGGFVDSTKTAEIKFFRRPRGDLYEVGGNNGPKRLVSDFNGVTGVFDRRYEAYVELPELTDFWADAIGSAAGGTPISVVFDILVIKNTPGGLVEPQ
jgi:hypothetical protein